MKSIPLSQGKFATVDDEDYEWLSQWKWSAKADRDKTFYAYRHAYLGNGQRKRINMHREIMMPPDDLFIDHIDHDGLNNQRSNLRICTKHQNMQNMNIHKNNTSGYKNIYWNGEGNVWIVQITISPKKRVSIGRFKDIDAAIMAYNAAIKLYHLDFASSQTKNATVEARK